MKTAIVPAQVTTVEDKVAGSLGLTQLVLLVTPLFIGTGIYALFPPVMKLNGFKMALVALLSLLCCSLAIRIRGKLLLHWGAIFAKYNTRPRYYVASKNSTFGRNGLQTIKQDPEPEPYEQAEPARERRRLSLGLDEITRLENLIANPSARVQFLTDKKGGFRVLVTEVKQEG